MEHRHDIQQTLGWFSSENFMPHGHCYLWTPELLWTFVVSETLIVLSYFSIPFALIYFVGKRRDLQFDWMFKLFSVFIFACGITHLLGIWTIWHPDYWADALAKACTAAISLVAAVLLWRLIPAALKIPTTRQLEQAVAQLEQEVMQRKEAEAQLAQLKSASDERFYILFEQAAAGVAEVDAATGNILRINGKYCDMLGYAQDELLGSDSLSVMHPEDAPAGKRKIRELKEWKLPGCSLEQRQLRKDGGAIWVNMAISPVWRTGGFPATLIVIAQDITERKRAEAELGRQLDELRRWHGVMLGRETRVLELKAEVNALLAAAGQPPRYADAAPAEPS